VLAFLKALVLLPVAFLVILFALANRGVVTVSFDPFSSGTPEISVPAPLWAVVFIAVALGVLIGGIGSWLAGRDRRRTTRSSTREINRLKAEADRLRASVTAGRPGLPAPY
jgi:hypothetical protein